MRVFKKHSNFYVNAISALKRMQIAGTRTCLRRTRGRCRLLSRVSWRGPVRRARVASWTESPASVPTTAASGQERTASLLRVLTKSEINHLRHSSLRFFYIYIFLLCFAVFIYLFIFFFFWPPPPVFTIYVLMEIYFFPWFTKTETDFTQHFDQTKLSQLFDNTNVNPLKMTSLRITL